jgi:hypothetical protein
MTLACSEYAQATLADVNCQAGAYAGKPFLPSLICHNSRTAQGRAEGRSRRKAALRLICAL